MIMVRNFFCFSILLVISSACHVKTSFRNLANQVDADIPKELYEMRQQLLETGKELSDFLPDGYSKDANIDYTAELQKGLEQSGVLLLPDHPLLVNKDGLSIKSNTKLVFRENSKLVMKPNSETHYAILDISNEENIEVFFANLEGDRDYHLTDNGEWGMGIQIRGGRNVNLHAPTISNCWGDGIYIRSLGGVNSEKVVISNFKIHRARRNGISIVSVDDLLIDNGVISGTRGTAPQSAVDIEPNRPTDVLKNIMIRDVITYDNEGDGVMILLSNLTLKGNEGTSPQNVNIIIENHTDIGSYYPVRISGRSRGDRSKFDRSLKLGGEIVFRNPKWVWSKDESPVRFSPSRDRVLEFGFNPPVRFENINILDDSKKSSIKQEKLESVILEEIKKL